MDSRKPKEQKRQVYHPYQDLNVPIQKLYNLPTAPEHLFPEEAARIHRSWGENLQYYTGAGYLSDAMFGAAKSTVQGLKAAGVLGLIFAVWRGKSSLQNLRYFEFLSQFQNLSKFDPLLHNSQVMQVKLSKLQTEKE